MPSRSSSGLALVARCSRLRDASPNSLVRGELRATGERATGERATGERATGERATGELRATGDLLNRTLPSSKSFFFFMALFTEGQFPITYDVPEGGGNPPHENDAVLLQMSDGTVAQIFDRLSTGLRLLAFMRRNSQWSVYASDDVVCVSVGAAKLLVMETGLIQQKLITSYLPIYLGGEVRWASRTTSLVLSTTDALKSVGFCHKGELPLAQALI
jgi:hypothetical protein